MMSKNKQKDKGVRWELEATKALNENFPDVWTRIPMSGALGTQLGIPALGGDLVGKYPFFPLHFRGEAKVGYGGFSMKVQKEWFDKIAKEAESSYSLPVVLLKFDRARSGVRYIIAMDFRTWDIILRELEELHNEYISLLERYERLLEDNG